MVKYSIVFLVLMLLFSPAAYASTQHAVGGSAQWSTGISASNWGADQTFTVGDTLLFTYGSTHAVDVVSSADFASCNSANPMESHITSPTTITLNATGLWHFICPRANHCTLGQKLAVNVTEAAGSGTSPGASVPATPSETPPVRAAAGKVGCGGRLMMSLVLMGIVGLIMG